MIGDELVLPLVEDLLLEVAVLEVPTVGLVAGQRDGPHVHQPLLFIVVKHLQ